MARVNNLTDFLTDVASAIKTKKGSSTVIPAANFDTEILALPSQGVYQTKETNITTNGNYEITPDTNYDAMDKLRLNVNVPIPQLQTKSYTFTQNTTTTLTPETNYDGFSSVDISINVPSGSGDVKLFDTVEHMQADPNPSEGDLAVVYRSDITIPSPGDTISSITPPATVVFDTAISGTKRLTLRGNNLYLDCRLTSTQFYIRDMSGTIYPDVRYTSSDGLTYTRTDTGAVSYDLGEEIEIPSTANTDILQFFQTGGMVFEGLYSYKSHPSDELIEGLTSVVSPSSYQTSTVEIRDIQRVVELVENKLDTDVGLGSHPSRRYSIIKINNIYRVYFGIYIDSTYGNIEAPVGLLFADDKSYVTFGPSHTTTDILITNNLADTNGTTYKPYCYDVDIINETVTDTQLSTSSFTQITVGSNIKMKGPELTNLGVLVQYNVANDGSIAYNVSYITSSGSNGTIKNVSTTVMDYLLADTQLTLSSSNQLLADIIGYGKNGIVTGDGTVLDNFTLYEFINSNIGEPYDIKTLHNSKIIYKNGSNNYNKTLLKHKTFDGTGICMFEKLNPLENAIGSPSAFVKYQYGYVLIKVNDTNTIFTFVYYDSNFNYRHTQTVNVSKKMYVDGRAVNWYEDNTGLYCLLSPISNTTDIGMLHILDTTATIKLSTKTGTYRFNWGIVTSNHYGISVSGTYSSSKYTLYINKYDYSANTVTNITTLSNISLSNTRTSFAEDADNVYVCIGNSSYTASSTYQNCKVYVISKSTYTVSKTIDTGSKYAVFTSASDTAPCLVIIDSSGNATVNLMINGNLEYQHNIARPTIEFYYWSKYMSNTQSLYITGGGYSFGYVSICTPTENNIVLPNIEWWSDTGNTYSSSLFSSAQPYDITENTIDVYTFTSTADFYHIHVGLTLDVTNTNEGEFMLPISDKTKSYMAYAYFGYIFDNNSEEVNNGEN